MNKSIVAVGALLAGIAIAAPMVSSSAVADDEQLAQAGPGTQGGPGMGRMGMGGWDRDGDGDGERDGGGHMGHRGPHGWMHRMMEMSPQQRCEERIARRAGVVAYTITKLNLTAEQRPLWDRVQGPLQQAGDRERQLCATLKPRDQRGQETLLDRVNRREQFLTTRLQAI